MSSTGPKRRSPNTKLRGERGSGNTGDRGSGRTGGIGSGSTEGSGSGRTGAEVVTMVAEQKRPVKG